MGLRKANGNYSRVVVEESTGPHVLVETYATEKVRRDGPGEFDQVVRRSVYVAPHWESELALAPRGKTLRDALAAGMYAAIKQDSMFVGTEDC